MFELTHGLAYLVFKYQLNFLLRFFFQAKLLIIPKYFRLSTAPENYCLGNAADNSRGETIDYTEVISFVNLPCEEFNFFSMSVKLSLEANMYSLYFAIVCQGDPGSSFVFSQLLPEFACEGT